jgi:putative ABC transport system ATP-binding protein
LSERVLALTAVSKRFKTADHELEVLTDITLDVKAGEIVAIVGPSGSGKTTLLSIAAGLEKATSGRVELCGVNLGDLNEDSRAALRLKNTGFVFQNFHLIPTLTAIQNVTLPLELQGANNLKLAESLLRELGLENRVGHYPNQLSGGEQQRVALARAFITKPKVLFADEPTGSLDRANAGVALDAMLNMARTAQTALLVVTHDQDVAKRCDRIVELTKGLSDDGGKMNEPSKVDQASLQPGSIG